MIAARVTNARDSAVRNLRITKNLLLYYSKEIVCCCSHSVCWRKIWKEESSMIYFCHDLHPYLAKSDLELKIYCGYKYTSPFMINRLWGLKQLWLQVNGHAWFYLLGFRRPERKGKKRKNQKWKYMSPPGIEPATLCILAGHIDHLAIGAVDYLCFKLVHCVQWNDR